MQNIAVAFWGKLKYKLSQNTPYSEGLPNAEISSPTEESPVFPESLSSTRPVSYQECELRIAYYELLEGEYLSRPRSKAPAWKEVFRCTAETV